MPLTVGTRLGPYEVTAQIGVGGMGEVYRATDTNLKRAVAVKVLPESVAADAERLARFQREAEVLASLNHPNIAAIYGLERSDGSTALVMELVEGPTLSDRIAEGAIPIDEALPIAKQIAEALEAAHEQGIIHRDLKPANIKVREDGTVKVLDFGLAKALAPAASPSPSVSQSPTITTPAMTQAGMILGTAAYMAPEQTKGREADKRSDIWAFGCVLYEMLTGRRAFEGEDITEVLAAVIKSEPDWAALSSEVPQPVRTLLHRCLVKDRRTRIADIAAALFVLNHEADVGASNTPAAAPSPLLPLWRRLVPITVALGIGVLVSGVGVWFVTRPASPSVVRTTITTLGSAALALQGADRDVSITPDGSRIVYRGNNQLLVRPLDQLEPTVLSGLGSPRAVFISPDGQWVGFFDENTIRKVAITGGPPATIAPSGAAPRGATWGLDGTVIFATLATDTGLQRVSADGGKVIVLTRPDHQQGEGDHLWPEFLPEREAVLYTITPISGSNENAQIAVLDLQTGTSKVLIRGGSHAHYVPTGHLVYGVAGTLRAVAFDLERLEVIGTPVPILEGVVTTETGAVEAASAANGSLVYVSGSAAETPRTTMVWVDRQGREQPINAPSRQYSIPRLGPDGERIAFQISSDAYDIWTYEFRRGILERLTLDRGQDSDVVWAPDGRRVAYYSSARDGGPGIFVRAWNGTGDIQRLTTGNHRPTSWSPDGSRIVFADLTSQGRAIGSSGSLDIGVVTLDATRSTRQLVASLAREDIARVSPDGHWLALETNETGQDEIFVRPFPDVDAGRWRVSTDGGVDPVWAHDGRTLFYRKGEAIRAVAVEGGSPASWGIPTTLFQGQYLFTSGPTQFDVAPDGRFLMLKNVQQSSTPPQLVVVLNWFQELKRLVPVN